MKKLFSIFFLSFTLSLLFISFVAYARQTAMPSYYPSSTGNYTKVHLVNQVAGGPATSSFCQWTSANGATTSAPGTGGATFINSGIIFADSTTGYLEVCKSDGSVASYPGSSFNRYKAGAACPALNTLSCPTNYVAVSCQPIAMPGVALYSWTCSFSGGAAATAKAGCFSIYSTGADFNPPASCYSQDQNAYDLGCDAIASVDMSHPLYKRNCCYNVSSGTNLLNTASACTCPNMCGTAVCGSDVCGNSCGNCAPNYWCSSGSCLLDTCQGAVPGNSTACANNLQPSNNTTNYVVVGSCNPAGTCQASCNANYWDNGGVCQLDVCQGAVPGNSTICGNNLQPGNNTTFYTVVNSCNPAGTCQTSCNANYWYNLGVCTLDACQGAVPGNSTICGNNLQPGNNTTSYAVVNSCNPAGTCQTSCNANYWDNGGVCQLDACQGAVPGNSTICGNNLQPGNNTTSYAVVNSCNPAGTCQTSCNANYWDNGGVCQLDACQGAVPGNSTICGNNLQPGNNTTSYAVVNSCNPAGTCQTSCNVNYWDNGGVCTLDACQGAVPGNSTACADNLQPSNNTTNYVAVSSCIPAGTCQASCNANYWDNGGVCTLDACQGAVPGNSTICGNNLQPGNNTTSYVLASSCFPAGTCQTSCNVNYTDVAGVCQANCAGTTASCGSPGACSVCSANQSCSGGSCVCSWSSCAGTCCSAAQTECNGSSCCAPSCAAVCSTSSFADTCGNPTGCVANCGGGGSVCYLGACCAPTCNMCSTTTYSNGCGNPTGCAATCGNPPNGCYSSVAPAYCGPYAHPYTIPNVGANSTAGSAGDWQLCTANGYVPINITYSSPACADPNGGNARGGTPCNIVLNGLCAPNCAGGYGSSDGCGGTCGGYCGDGRCNGNEYQQVCHTSLTDCTQSNCPGECSSIPCGPGTASQTGTANNQCYCTAGPYGVIAEPVYDEYKNFVGSWYLCNCGVNKIWDVNSGTCRACNACLDQYSQPIPGSCC